MSILLVMLSFLIQIMFSVLPLYNGFDNSPLIVLEALDYCPSQLPFFTSLFRALWFAYEFKTNIWPWSSGIRPPPSCWSSFLWWLLSHPLFLISFLLSQPFCQCPSFVFFSSMVSLGPSFLFFSLALKEKFRYIRR